MVKAKDFDSISPIWDMLLNEPPAKNKSPVKRKATNEELPPEPKRAATSRVQVSYVLVSTIEFIFFKSLS